MTSEVRKDNPQIQACHFVKVWDHFHTKIFHFLKKYTENNTYNQELRQFKNYRENEIQI